MGVLASLQGGVEATLPGSVHGEMRGRTLGKHSPWPVFPLGIVSTSQGHCRGLA